MEMKMKIQFRVPAAVAALALASWGQDDLTTWSRYKDITVNTQAAGANVAVDVANFPVLVRLTEANANDVFTQALAGGADIRFASPSGAQRPYEIEHWDATAKTASIWVLADTVKGNSNTTTLRMYWGRSGVAGASNGAAVFDTANGYVAVWHMNGADTEVSSTAHGFVATPFGEPGTNTASATGRGRTFNGSQYFRVIGSASGALNFPLNGTYTLSAWVYADSVITPEPGAREIDYVPPSALGSKLARYYPSGLTEEQRHTRLATTPDGAVRATLPDVGVRDRETALRLAREGPPAEEVGLEPFGPLLEDHGPGGGSRR
jgi:hypothetical protein